MQTRKGAVTTPQKGQAMRRKKKECKVIVLKDDWSSICKLLGVSQHKNGELAQQVSAVVL